MDDDRPADDRRAVSVPVYSTVATSSMTTFPPALRKLSKYESVYVYEPAAAAGGAATTLLPSVRSISRAPRVRAGSCAWRSFLRRGLGRTGRTAAASAPAGVAVLDDRLRATSATPAAADWIAALPGAAAYAAFGMLPAMVDPLATRARAGRADGLRVLERAVDHRWVVIEAAALEGGSQEAIAVTFRGATSAETFDRLARVYGLTRRERELVAAVLLGLDTAALAHRLSIARHTVQDHLKSVFTKVGIRSRRELVALFAAPGRPSVDLAEDAS